jgi:acyl-CoA thioesterase I
MAPYGLIKIMFAYFRVLDKSRYLYRASRYLQIGALFAILLSPPSALAAEKTASLLVIGDSLAAGYGLPASDAFTTRLEAALTSLGHRVRVINAGVSGDPSAGGRARIGWSLAGKPDAVLIELGANDGMRGLEPAATKANLDAILSQIRSAGAEILLTGMLAPPNLGREYGAEFAALYPALARRHGVLFYPFFLEGVAANPELNQADRIHPNAAGVEIIVERLLPKVKDLLQRVRNKREPGR